MIQLPENFIKTIKGVFKEDGEKWLQNFDELILYCEDKWSFNVQSIYPLSYNFAASVTFIDGSEAVLKLGVPNKEFETEIAALRLFDGQGMARLIDSEMEKGIMILEKLNPGKTLKTIENDEEATRIASSVMRKINVPAPSNSNFPAVSDWAKGLEKLRIHFNGGTGPFPEEMVERAEDLFKYLLSTERNLQLLHGDLHHDNILSAEREPWMAIDPKGVIGEPEYGVIQFLLNNLPDHNKKELTENRMNIFAEELQLDKERLIMWAFCHSILSSWWHIEDNTIGLDGGLEMAKVFYSLIK